MFLETGHSIPHEMRIRKLRWVGHVTWSSPSGNLYTEISALMVEKRQCGGLKTRYIDRINKEWRKLERAQVGEGVKKSDSAFLKSLNEFQITSSNLLNPHWYYWTLFNKIVVLDSTKDCRFTWLLTENGIVKVYLTYFILSSP